MMDPLQRPPSTAWEQVPLPELPGAAVWVWFRPPTAPAGLVFQVPLPTWQAFGGRLTVRRLVTAVGLFPQMIQAWTIQGTTVPAMMGTNPLLDHPLPPPIPGVDSTIIVHLASVSPPAAAPPVMPMQPAAVPTPGAVADRGSESVYAAIDSDWNAIRLIEAQLMGVRKQLNGLAGKLQSLNRDLNTEERMAADNQDTREWQDVRRWLRDSAAQVSRALRNYDIGVTSAAGNRNRFDDLYEKVIAPRRPVEGLAAIQLQFESHRKTVQSVQTEMQSVLTTATRDGEQRAQQLLSRIHTKMRKKKTH
jgi:hypothetical protein